MSTSRIHPAAADNAKCHPLLDRLLITNHRHNTTSKITNTIDHDHHHVTGGDDHVTISTDDVPIPVPVPVPIIIRRRPVAVLTVWKRSSMSFQGTDGFTVFDHNGGLAFRVDNYSRNSHRSFTTTTCSCAAGSTSPLHVRSAGLVLMDGSGKPLLTLKPPQIFSMQHQWSGYRGGGGECGSIGRRTSTRKSRWSSSVSSTNRVFTMRRPISTSVRLLIGSQSGGCEAEVLMMGNNNMGVADFRIEGSFWRRNCIVRDNRTGEVAAKIVRKRSAPASASASAAPPPPPKMITLSDDVFSLVVQPPFDPQLMMSFAIVLDRICVKPFAPSLICS